MTPRKSFVFALVCSFSVYLIPIVGPHAAFFLGEALWRQTPTLHNQAWAIADIAVAVALQTVAFAIFYWFWRRRSVTSVAAILIGAVAAVVFVQFAYMLWLPAYFMIEAETAPETGSWPEVCSVSDASMMVFHTPARLPSGGWKEVWLGDSHAGTSILRMPGCQRTTVTLPRPHMEPGGRVDFSIGISQVVPGGLALVQRQDVASGAMTWFLLAADTDQLQPLDLPSTNDHSRRHCRTTDRPLRGSRRSQELVLLFSITCTFVPLHLDHASRSSISRRSAQAATRSSASLRTTFSCGSACLGSSCRRRWTDGNSRRRRSPIESRRSRKR